MINSSSRRALAEIMASGGLHRADLARRLGVARTTASNIANGLLDEGLVVGEFQLTPPPPGEVRLKEKLLVAPAAGLLAAITTLTRSTTVSVAALDGRVLALARWPEPVQAPGAARLVRAAARIRQLTQEEGLAEASLLGVLVTVNVQTDRETGEAVSHDDDSVWLDTNPASIVAAELRAPVVLENTARLQGLVAHGEEAGRSARNLVYVHLSHGVGMSHVVDGRLVTGSRGGSGEIGHMVVDPGGEPCWCGKQGCLTTRVSLPRLAAAEGVAVADLTDPEQSVRLSSGRVRAAGWWAGRALGEVCNLLGPDVLVVGGELARYGPDLLDPLAAQVLERCLPLVARHLRIVPSHDFDDPAALCRAATAHLVQGRIDELVDAAVESVRSGGQPG